MVILQVFVVTVCGFSLIVLLRFNCKYKEWHTFNTYDLMSVDIYKHPGDHPIIKVINTFITTKFSLCLFVFAGFCDFLVGVESVFAFFSLLFIFLSLQIQKSGFFC